MLHHAIPDNQDWSWWCEEVVAAGICSNRTATGRPPSSNKMSRWRFGPRGRIPIPAGIGAFRIMDEACKRMSVSPRGQALLFTDTMENDHVVDWQSPYETSFVIYLQLGHGSHAHRDRSTADHCITPPFGRRDAIPELYAM